MMGKDPGPRITFWHILTVTDHKLQSSLRTSIYVVYHPPVIACASIWLACRDCQVKLPTNPGAQWWDLFEADMLDIQTVAGHIKSLYYLKYDRKAVPLTVEELSKRL